MQNSVILARKMWCCHHFSRRFCKNVVLSKQVKNQKLFWHFSISKKAHLPAIRITEQPVALTKSKINFLGYKLSIFFKNGQSNLVLVLVLFLESKGPYCCITTNYMIFSMQCRCCIMESDFNMSVACVAAVYCADMGWCWEGMDEEKSKHYLSFPSTSPLISSTSD